MKLIPEDECYSTMPTAEYGHDAYGNPVEVPECFELVPRLEWLREGVVPFDVYSGWLKPCFYNPKYHTNAFSNGRWTAWAKPISTEKIKD